MKVFLSWSGNRSRLVAELLRDWIRCVLQATRPWISTRDLDRGSVWFAEINEQLKDTAIGIICLTGDNKDKPWILFEAGALAKGLNSNRVCTFLVDLQPTDVEDPLAQFNHTFPNKSGLLALVETINNALGPNALDHRILQQVFDTYWPQFDDGFKQILAEHPPEAASPPRDERDLLAEILDHTRALNSRIGRLELDREASSRTPSTVITDGQEPISPMAARMLSRRWFERGMSPQRVLKLLVARGINQDSAQHVVDWALAAHERAKDTTNDS